MKSIVAACVAAVLLFALSAALSLYLTSSAKPEADHDGKKAAGDHKGEKKKRAEGKDHLDEAKDGKDRHDDRKEAAHKEPVDPPSKRPDDAVALLERLRQRAADLENREGEIRAREQRVQLVIDDIGAERAVMDSIRAQIAGEIKGLDENREKMDRSTRSLEDQKRAAQELLAQLEKEKTSFGKDELKNIDQIALIFESMPADKAARMLEQLANSGQMETAVKLLGRAKERRAAAILAEVGDVALSAQLVDKLRGLKRPVPPDSPK
ncbi:MAG: hypothetical protein K2W96_21030 [Gemmataceae bacterium]|nr:hypothetical protein [Gemmataceae bacterium]